MDTFCYPYEDICWWYGDSLDLATKFPNKSQTKNIQTLKPQN